MFRTMAIPIFTLNLGHFILPGSVTIGKYDGSHSCLTAATIGDKILIHNPHRHDRKTSLLNVNQGIRAICAGRLNLDDEKDILAIGTPTSLLAYHVDNNTDLFYKDVRQSYALFCTLHSKYQMV
uniref:Ciliary BBSome complex subunit 2 N-terminal domain-containing protein n=1 Tax=Clastoptera arizonana TaxID=38151 RepID=A0A1B6D4U4_9HEMI